MSGLKWDRSNDSENKWYFKAPWTIQQAYFVYDTLTGHKGFEKYYPKKLVKEMKGSVSSLKMEQTEKFDTLYNKIITESTYWERNGKFQEDYDTLFDKLVPTEGKSESLQGEVLRAASRLYYRWFNDGDKIEYQGPLPCYGTSVVNAFGFLIEYAADNNEKLHMLLNDLMAAKSDEEYEEILEEIADEAILIAKTEPLIPNDKNMLDKHYFEVGKDTAEFQEEDEEEDEDYSDTDEEEPVDEE